MNNEPEPFLAIGTHQLVVADPAMIAIYALVRQLASAQLPVLVTGETGCGKELIAHALHAWSPCASRRPVSLNCAVLHESLVESELFGHERGAFSGAIAGKQGLIEAASGSTLFLDEIGELTLANQAKLLRVLETGRYMRVGDTREYEACVRIVAATNRDLQAEVQAGRFRRDLYYRLAAALIHLPPLRLRLPELPFLARTFLAEACTAQERTPMQISDGAIAGLRAHPWPGNVRELKHVMEYVAATVPYDEVLAEHVSARLAGFRSQPLPRQRRGLAGQPNFRPLADELRELQITRIREALDATGGVQAHAARLLDVPLRTFADKVKLYRLGRAKAGNQ